MRFLRYLKARFGEASTYAGIVAAITGGSLLNHPWDYVAIAVGVLGVLVPQSGKAE